ncbi:MAG: hypothetical protein ABSB12_01645 [Candidatus Saccharimonadales bacterium]|jgi:hypothetical protein
MVKIFVFLSLALVLGLSTTLITDLFSKNITNPTNISYDSSDVLYYGNPLVSVTNSKYRGFPFVSRTKVVAKYSNEEFSSSLNKRLGLPTSTITVQLPAVSSRGSNSYTEIFRTWQFYTNALIWTISWLLLGYSIKAFRKT